MEVTTFDFGDVCIGTIEDDETTVNAQGVVTFGSQAMLQLAPDATGRLDRLKAVEPGYLTFVGADGLTLTDRDYQAIAAVPGLRSVDFDNTNIGDRQVGYFCSGGVRALNLGTPSVGDGAMQAVAAIKDLQFLVLSRSAVTDAGLAILSGLAELDTLHLPESQVTVASAPVIASLPKLENLQMDRVNDDVVIAAARPHSAWLHFREAIVSARGLEALEHCTALETFALISSVLDDETARALRHLHAVTALFLNGASFSDPALADGLRELPALEFLGVARSPASDATAAALAQLPNLATAAFADAAITDEGLRALSTSKSLQSLHLARTAVTDAGIAYLASVATLEDLITDGTAVTEAGRAVLTQLPKPFELG